MALGLELKLRMGMQLVMTPQLQLAIRLLQMSTLDLEDYLQEELEKNPLLEHEDDAEDGGDLSGALETRERAAADDDGFGEEAGLDGEFGEDFRSAASERGADPRDDVAGFGEDGWEDREVREEGLDHELAVDASWSDIYDGEEGGSGVSSRTTNTDSSEAPPIENTLCAGGTLTDHLIWQLGLSARNERERVLGLMVIDAIDDNGYLTQTLEALAVTSRATVDEIEDVLTLIHSFEPAGVGARGLAECLLLQLKAEGMAHPPYSELLKHLEDLARRDFRKLSRILKLTEGELAEAMSVITSLNPKPGLAFGSEQAAYVVPDVFVRKHLGKWIVETNPDTIPRLRINRRYQDAIGGRVSPQDKKFLVENARSAQWLLKSLEQRASTILRVATSIVNFQKDFLEFGPEQLRPLILKDVADDIGVHESTISRVTNNKYMHTPRGIFELKFFFSSSLPSDSGDAHSSEAVKFKIRKLVEGEPPRHPYSDEKLVQLLGEQGINVARRTVAKYREALGISSSARRKRLGGGE